MKARATSIFAAPSHNSRTEDSGTSQTNATTHRGRTRHVAPMRPRRRPTEQLARGALAHLEPLGHWLPPIKWCHLAQLHLVGSCAKGRIARPIEGLATAQEGLQAPAARAFLRRALPCTRFAWSHAPSSGAAAAGSSSGGDDRRARPSSTSLSAFSGFSTNARNSPGSLLNIARTLAGIVINISLAAIT